jgi:hypothetical protein
LGNHGAAMFFTFLVLCCSVSLHYVILYPLSLHMKMENMGTESGLCIMDVEFMGLFMDIE